MVSSSGPTLIKNKIAERIENIFTMVKLHPLPDVGMLTVNDINTGINELVGKINPPGFGLGLILVSPMNGDN